MGSDKIRIIVNEQNLRKIYRDILLGYSEGLFDSKLAYIKHFNALDQGDVDVKYLELYKEASKVLETETDKLEELAKAGEWTTADENWIVNHRIYLENLYKTRDHPLNAQTRGETIKIIETAEKEVNDRLNKKSKLLGVTAESWAARRVNEFYIYLSLYSDSSLSNYLFTEDEYNNLDDNDLEKIVLFYNDIMVPMNKAVKKIAISPSFQSSFSLCEDNISDFYGLPISRLTFYQVELAIYGRYFKNILSEPNIPFNVRNDPDLLINWHNGDKNIAAPVQTEQVLGNLNKEAVKTGGKIKGNLNVMKAMQGLQGILG